MKLNKFIFAVLLAAVFISQAAANISGQVKDTSGTGVQSTVQLLDSSTRQVVASVSSDIGGSFTVTGVPAGRFFIRANPLSGTYLPGETDSIGEILSYSDGDSSIVIVLSTSTPQNAVYVGSNACRFCHNNTNIAGLNYGSWLNTWHRNAFHDPDPARQGVAKEGVVGDFSKNPVLGDAANNISNVTIGLNFDGTNYMVTIGNVPFKVNKVMGGLWKQRYLTKIGSSYYVLPVQWNVATRQWVAYNLNHWFKTDGSNTPVYGPGDTPVSKGNQKDSWDRLCAGCHAATGLTVSINAAGEYVASDIETNISCENCHGPASEHTKVGGGLAKNIIRPDLLVYERANEVCGQCHNRGLAAASLDVNSFEYPYNASKGGIFKPGLELDDFFMNYSMKDAAAANFWRADRSFPEEGLNQGDAIAGRAHREQWPELKGRAKHANNSFRLVSCFDCHDPHGSSNSFDIVEESDGKAVTDSRSLCLSCHQKLPPFQNNVSLIGSVDGDTDHFTGIYSAMRGIGCVECHMVRTGRNAVGPDPVTKEFDEPSHTFTPIKPQFSTNGMPNSCTKCHTSGGIAFTSWNLDQAQRVFTMLDGSVLGVPSTYVGKDFCRICHTNTTGIPQVYDGWNRTNHSSAYNRKFLPQVLNASGNETKAGAANCRPCHTVGFGKPGGYVNFNTTPQLTNIQCENCHGAGSKHEVEVNISARVCGECHQGGRRPTIDEWERARHSKAKERFSGRNATTFTPCLQCHSGDYRLSRNKALIPDATNITKFGVTCAVCHDAHSAANPRQLREPTPTAMCSQCHSNYDSRGPDFVEANPEIRAMTGDAPHNFQVEMRAGRGGFNVSSIAFMPEVGCSECHMFTRGYISVSQPAITGHTFEVNTTACRECHVREANLIQPGAGDDTFTRHATLGIFRIGRTTCENCHLTGEGQLVFSATGYLATWQSRISDLINSTQVNVTLAKSAAITQGLMDTYNISKFDLDIVAKSDRTRGAHNPDYAMALLRQSNTLAKQVMSGGVGAVRRYDLDGDGIIEKNEAIQAVSDFFAGLITRQDAIAVVAAFFSG